MASALSMKLCPSRARVFAGLGAQQGAAGGTAWRARLLMVAGLAMATQAAQALDLSFSGFGTIGYAVSDQPYRYQRFLHDRGSFQRDTVLGAQADVKFSPQWSATYQAMAAPSMGNDEDWSLKTTWAFVSWRPDNDWLLRVGKQRVPLFLNAENRNVGQTYDFARLPAEVYGLAPTTDLIGLYVSRSWLPAIGETTLDMFAGEANMVARAHARDLGPVFMPVNTDVRGLALTLRQEKATWRVGLHHVATSMRGGGRGFPSHYPSVPIVPGVSYYDVAGPGTQYAKRIINDVITLGADIEVAPSWRVMAEVVRNIQMRTENGANTAGGYVAVLHKIDRFTPYVSFAKLRSVGDSMKTVRGLDGSVVPYLSPAPADVAAVDALNMSQRVGADIIQAYDQDSLAIGTSFAVTPSSKLKLEWMRTRIGNRSAMVDSPAGGDAVRHQHIQVLSLNYNFVF
jgi:hypothetical protein